MNDLTDSEIIFLMKVMDGIANGMEAIDPGRPYAMDDYFGYAYNGAIKLRRKLFDELERRIKNEAESKED